jgi:hypothetical protein
MTAVIDEEGKKIREAVRWISEMCLLHPERKRTSFILEAEAKFDLSPKEAEFLLRKLSGEGA